MVNFAKISPALNWPRIRLALVSAFTGLVIILSLTFAYLNTETGKNHFTTWLGASLSSENAIMKVSPIDGSIFSSFFVSEISFSDQNGVWLKAENTNIKWSPLSLFKRQLNIASINVELIQFYRKPIGKTAADTSNGNWFSVPALPVDVNINALDIIKLNFLKIASFKASSVINLTSDQDTIIKANLININNDNVENADQIAVDISYTNDDQQLLADVTLTAENGGAFAIVLGFETERDLFAKFYGSGTLDNWQGNFNAKFGETEVAKASITRTDLKTNIEAQIDAGDFITDDNKAIFGSLAMLSLDIEQDENLDHADLLFKLNSKTLVINADGVVKTKDDTNIDQVNFSLNVLDAKPFNRFLAPLNFKPFTATGIITSLATNPKITMNTGVVETGYGVDLTGLVKLKLEAMMMGQNISFNTQTDITNISGHNPIATLPLAKEGFIVGLTGLLERPSQILSISQLEVSNKFINLNVSGQLFQETGALNAQITSALGDLAAIGGMAGSMDLVASLNKMDQASPLLTSINMTMAEIDVGDEILNELLSTNPTLAADIISYDDGKVEIANMALKSNFLSLNATADVSPAQLLEDGKYNIEFLQLENMQSLKNMALTGSVRAEGLIHGPLQSPSITFETTLNQLVLQSFAMDNVVANINAENIINDLDANFALAASTNFGELAASTKLNTVKDIAYKLSDINITLGAYSANGAIELPFDQPALGAVAIRTDKTKENNGIVSGEVNADIVFSSTGEHQQTALTGNMKNFKFPVGEQDFITLETGQIEATAILPDTQLDTPPDTQATITLDASFSNISHQRFRSENLHIMLAQENDLVNFNISSQSALSMPHQLSITGSSSIANEKGRLITLGLTGNIADTAINTAQPLQITLVENGFSTQPFNIGLGAGYISGSLALNNEGINANMLAQNADLTPSEIIFPEIPFSGLLTGELKFVATKQDVDGSFDLALSHVKINGTEPFQGNNVVMDMKAKMNASNVEIIGNINAREMLSVKTSATLPIEFDVAEPSIKIMPELPIAAEIIWQDDIQPIWPLFSLANHELSGKLDSVLKLSGTLSEPDIDGHIKLKDGRYENLQAGFVAADIDLFANILDSKLVLEHLTATDSAEGTITGSGKVGINPDFTFDAQAELQLDKAHILRLPEFDVVATSNLQFLQNRQTSQITGVVNVDKADVGAITTGAPNIIVLDVREINGEDLVTNNNVDNEYSSKPINLDLKFNVPNKLFVRSYGLDSEWMADLKITGTMNNPIVAGEASLIRGSFEFSSIKFNLSHGNLTFPADPSNDPLLDISAEQKLSNLQVYLDISGRASKPNLKVTSDPSLPQDEILSRILFGTSISELSVIEAVQLASAAHSLSKGGGSGMVGKVRGKLGLSRLSIEGSDDHEFGTTITGGRYITNNVYVEVSTSPTTGEAASSIEVQLSDKISLVTSRTIDNDSNLAIRWSWRY